jgi:Protein of unknown function (DUF1579)
MKKLILAAFLFTTTALATTAVAQQTHKEYEPPAEAGAGQKLLLQIVGDFDMEKKFFPATGQPTVTKGTVKQFMVQGGKFLESDFTFADPDGSKSTGVGIIGFDAKTNRFTSFWYDSTKTSFSVRQSDGTFDGKTIVLWATSLDPDRPGRKTYARMHLEENGRVLVHQHFAIDDQGKERLVLEWRMTKK